MLWFKSKEQKTADTVEEKFQKVVDIIKDLDKANYTRLMAGVEHVWQGYEAIRKVETRGEKEDKDIYAAEEKLSKLTEEK